MKLELYSMPNCKEAEKIKEFLVKNNLPFKETIVDNPETDKELRKLTYGRSLTSLKITKSHSIYLMVGFNEFYLWIIPLIRVLFLEIFQIDNSEKKVLQLTELSINQEILEHIQKYNAYVAGWN